MLLPGICQLSLHLESPAALLLGATLPTSPLTAQSLGLAVTTAQSSEWLMAPASIGPLVDALGGGKCPTPEA